MSGPTIRSIFRRIDSNQDERLQKPEIKQAVEDAGVGSGLLGGAKVNKTTDAMMDKFDADKDGAITQAEFREKISTMLPGVEASANGPRLSAQMVEWLNRADKNGDGLLSKKEVSDFVEAEMNARGKSMAGTVGDISGKMAMQLFDENGDGKLSKEELTTLATDVESDLTK